MEPTPTPPARDSRLRLRIAAVLIVMAALGLALWRAELFTVAAPGDGPRALTALAEPRPAPELDVMLPVVPVGVARIRPGGAALLVHYWAPWERHSRAQILALDSLQSTLPRDSVRVVVVCLDPFPSVSRYVNRVKVRSAVHLDLRRELQASLPCPSMPFTWVLDREGRVTVRQAGEVDWLAPETRARLLEAARGAAPGRSPGSVL